MGLVDKNGTIITPVGGVASAALPAAVDAGQPVRAYFDQNGRLHVVLDGESVVVNVGEVQIEGSSDGGTTWYPVKVSAAGVQTHAIDQTTPGTTNGVYVTGGTVAVTLGSAALEAETVLVNGATVTFGNISAITPFDNHTKLDRYVRFRVSCNKAHTVTFYSADSTFSTLAAGERLRSYTTTGLTDNSTTLGDIYDVEVDGAAYVACVLTNNDGANSATVTIAGRGHN